MVEARKVEVTEGQLGAAALLTDDCEGVVGRVTLLKAEARLVKSVVGVMVEFPFEKVCERSNEGVSGLI